MIAVGGQALTVAGNTTACPQCHEPMRAVPLEGHYGPKVPVDLCPHCNLVWFDEFESVRLSGLGWVTLLREMQAAVADAFTGALKAKLGCPRCNGTLKPVHNLTRFGRFASLECPGRHGHLQTFSLLLAERGMVRPLAHADWQALREESREPSCLNCGAGISPGTDRCAHCESPLVAIDMPRLMAALLIRHAEPLPYEAAGRVTWPCHGCGAALAPNETARCEHCHHPVVVPSFVDLKPLLDTIEPLLRAARPREARPHGEKLRAMRGDYTATAAYRYMRHLFQPESLLPSGQGWIALAALAAFVGWMVLR